MEITHLDKKFLYEALAKECNFDHDDADCWHEQIGIGCPFEPEDDGRGLCKSIKPEHWREVFEGENELNPRFSFGDKVRVDGMQAVFVRYSDKSHKTAYIVYEGSLILPERQVATLKTGWK